MTFLEHLEELRWVLMRSAIAVVVCMIAVFIWIQDVFEKFIMGPASPDFITYRALCALGRKLGLGDQLCVQGMSFHIQSNTMQMEFTMSFSIAITLGFIIASPFVIWQVWRFVAPGLKEKERNAVRGTVFFVVLLFLLGTAFAYFVVAPMSIQFFATYSLSSSIEKRPTLDSYVSILNSFLLWTGLAFELPVVMYFLSRIGIVGPGFLRTYRKHAFVAILVVAAIITPPDVVSQILVSLPLLALYEVSILLAARSERQRIRAESAPPVKGSRNTA
ncbi:MAG TPA: twin-arginine translocase subunit TatC [Flavobacteriales bacterium]|nr:twin-arginine translocase subunit TatC [Flavobacteriales bacterium]